MDPATRSPLSFFIMYSGGSCPTHLFPRVVSVVFPTLLKQKHPIIALPLFDQFLRLHNEPDFRDWKAIWTLAYTEMLNVGIMGRVFGRA